VRLELRGRRWGEHGLQRLARSDDPVACFHARLDAFDAVEERPVARLQPGHQAEALHFYRVDADIQLRPEFAERQYGAIDVARPDLGVALARGVFHGIRQDVVDGDDAAGMRRPLDVHEVAQGEFGQVHSVDEREVHGCAEYTRRILR